MGYVALSPSLARRRAFLRPRGRIAALRVLGLGVLGLASISMSLAANAQTRPDDSYHPPADTSVLTPPPGYENPPQQNGYGQNTYGQPQPNGQQPPGGPPTSYGQPPSYGQTQTYGQAPAYGQPPPYGSPAPYGRSANSNQQNGGYQPYSPGQGGNDTYNPPRADGYSPPPGQSYGAPYSGPGQAYQDGPPPYSPDGPTRGYYSENEIVTAGQGFFGAISKGLASAIEYTYSNVGRPNGYILGEDGSGAYFAGLRYGEGKLFTKDAGDYKVYWQGPSLGLDIGGEGSKIMILVYNLRDPGDIFNRFGGVEGSTYIVGGVSVQLQKYGDVTLALIRSGIGLRLGVNVGYLKYTREPTWNPF